MKKLSILCSILFASILSLGQTVTCPVGNTCNVLVTGPSATSGPVKITLEVNNPTPPTLDDLVLWSVPLPASRTSQHINGNAVKYFWIDPIAFFWEKGSLGNPQDIESYDNSNPATDRIYHWITENGDSSDTTTCVSEGYAGGCFGNPFAYKRFVTPVAVAPRYFDTTGASGDFTITHASPNHYIRTTNCEVDAQPVLNLGNLADVTHYNGPTAFGGTIGTQNSVVITTYYGLSSINPPYQSGSREQFFLVKGIGQVEWTNAHWDVPSQSYIITQTSLNGNQVTGGAPVPFVPCGQLAGSSTWWSGYTQTDNNGNLLSSVTISLASNSINVSTSTTGTGTGHYVGGGTANITNGLYWTSSDNTIAAPAFTRTNPRNIACTTVGGTVTITATDADGHAGTASLTCNAAAPPCLVTITPSTATVLINGTQTFTPTVTNCSPSTVTWKVNGVIGGNSTIGTISVGGLYTAPAVIPNPSTVTIAAVSNADPTKSDTSTVTITAPNCAVDISPLTVSILTGANQTFTPTTTNCTPSSVHWQVNGITGGNSTVGTITTGGVYTAPALVPTPNTVTVTDVSDQDNTTHGSASVTITAAPICSVSIVPLLASVKVGLTQQFTGSTNNCSPSTVTWKVNTITGGNSTVGTVSVSGLYTAPAAIPATNPVTVTAVSNADNTKVANASITVTTTSVNLMDKYCGVSDVPSFGATDSYASLPKTCNYTDPSIRVMTGTVRTVTAATWNSVWAATQCGDIVEIAAGTTLLGNFTIPTKTCSAGHYWTLRTSGYASLPPYGTKVSPCYANTASMPGRPNFNCPGGTPANIMATIQTNNTNPPLTIATNNAFGQIIGIVFTRSVGGGEVLEFVTMNTGGVNHIIFDHVWGKGTSGDETNRFVVGNRVNNLSIINSFFTDFHCSSAAAGQCTDAKVFGGGTNNNATDTDHTWKIVNNFMEGAAQTVLFGGAAAAITPQDIEFRRNWGFKPLIWDQADPSYNGGGLGAKPWIVKNLYENKNAQLELIEANVFQNVWGGFSQVGEALTLTPKNQSGTLCPGCFVRDVTVRNNRFNSVCQAFQLVNTTDGGPNGYALFGFNYSIHDNIVDNMSASNLFQCQSSAAAMTLNNSSAAPSSFIIHNVDVNHNTFVLSGSGVNWSNNTIGMEGAASPNNPFNIKWQNNVFSFGKFGVMFNSTGSATNCIDSKAQIVAIANSCWTGNVITGNVFVGPINPTGAAYTPHPTAVPPTVNYSGNTYTFPVGTCLFESTLSSLFVSWNNGNNGNYTIKPGSNCHNAGNDGRDPGADIATTNSMTAGVDSF